MKKVQPGVAQNRKEKRARDEGDAQQKGTLDVWIKGNKEELRTVKDDVGVAENSSDRELEDETEFSHQSPFPEDNSTSGEENKDNQKEQLSTFFGKI